MHITVDYITRRFGYFNDLIFEGKLPPIPITLSHARTYLGQFRIRRPIQNIWHDKRREYSMRFSTLHDLPNDTVDDVIIHEMIHYHITYSGIRDTSPHGIMFRKIMDDINRKFARHIRISHKIKQSTPVAISRNDPAGHNIPAPETAGNLHVVAVLIFDDNVTTAGIKVLPRRTDKIIAYHKAAINVDGVSDVKLYLTRHIYFDSFPVSAALQYHSVCLSDLTNPLEHSRPIIINDNRLYISRT